jgi:hypothetical protein
VYRCWVVYGRSWRAVALPIALWVTCLVTLGLVAGSYAKTAPQALFPTIFISCHIPNNIYGTSMIRTHTPQRSALTIRAAAIIYRILRVANTSNYNSRRLRKTCRILIESGILYAVSGILKLVFVVDGNLRDKSLYVGFADIFVCSPLCS